MEQKHERKSSPEYSLTRVKELARSESVQLTQRSTRDSQDLGYSFEQVCECLAELERADFEHSVRYEGTTVWLDVYKMRNRTSTSRLDDLYIKIRLNRDCITVTVCSFHTELYL
jgi:hypothetical protein